MARDKNDTARNSKQMQTYADNINQKMQDIYSTVYSTPRRNIDVVDQKMQDIEATVRQIIQRNPSVEVSNITSLFSRVQLRKVLNDKKSNDKLMDAFNDDRITNGLLQDYMQNKWIVDLDNEIDLVCRYLPKLEQALEILKYATLTSDNYSKDFINVQTMDYNKDEMSIFISKFDALKKKYELVDKVSSYYDHMSHYGERWVYYVPYSKEVQRLLQRKVQNTRNVWDFSALTNVASGYYESSLLESTTIKEASDIAPALAQNNNCFKIFFDKSGILDSAITEHSDLVHCLTESNMYSNSIHEQFLNEAVSDTKDVTMTHAIDPNGLELPKGFEDDSSMDGLIVRGKNKSEKETKIKVPGCVIQELERANILPMYAENVFLGAYYLEFKTEENVPYTSKIASRTNMAGTVDSVIGKANQEQGTDYSTKLLNYVSAYIASQIDADFVNKNQDLQKEIYAILKHNDVFNDISKTEMIKITFLPADDVIQFAFKKDPKTHRGISDLEASLIPAKLAACIMVTDAIGNMTRGQDKRVYYVRQNVETNISQTLLNVISQIKKSNFGLRQIESMNNILNIVGKFNDYVIPVGQAGDAPVQFEVMPGQQIETNTELLDRLTDMAFSNIVPKEIMDSISGIDYSAQITTSNIQFIRKVFSRQATLENLLSTFFTNLYNYEYGTNITITCKLPAPIFLQLNNINQIIQSATDYATQLSEMEYPPNDNDNGETEQLKAIFKKNLFRYNLSSYIKIDEIDMIKEQSKLELEMQKKNQDEENNM